MGKKGGPSFSFAQGRFAKVRHAPNGCLSVGHRVRESNKGRLRHHRRPAQAKVQSQPEEKRVSLGVCLRVILSLNIAIARWYMVLRNMTCPSAQSMHRSWRVQPPLRAHQSLHLVRYVLMCSCERRIECACLSCCCGSLCGAGSSKREEFDHQYVGPGMPQVADSRCHASYVGGGSTIGSQISRPSSPAFSFGKKTQVVLQARRPTAPRPNSTPSGQKGMGEEGDDRPMSVPGRDRRKTVKYGWLRGGAKQQTQKNRYTKAIDGADMPRANEYSKQPSFAFGKDERFSDRIYIPHKPVVRSGTTPGPIYELPESIGQARLLVDYRRCLNAVYCACPTSSAAIVSNLVAFAPLRQAPAYSFPKVSDRTHPDAKRAEKEKRQSFIA